MSIDQSGKSVDERLQKYLEPESPKAEEQQPEPMPSSEKTAEVSVSEQTEKVAEAPKEQEADDLVLPENASERTREQFNKLKARLREKEELLAKNQTIPESQPEMDYGTSVFDSFRKQEVRPQTPEIPQMPPVNAPYLNPLQVQNIQQQYIDQEGNVDIQAVNKAIWEANQRAYEAQLRAAETSEKIARIEENSQIREAHSQFPEIDPLRKDKFDKKLYEAVRDRLLRNKWEGTEKRLIDVVTEVKNSYFTQPNPQVVKEEAIKEYQKTQQNRNQGPFESGTVQKPSEDLGELRKLTRRGGQTGDRALSDRLRALGI